MTLLGAVLEASGIVLFRRFALPTCRARVGKGAAGGDWPGGRAREVEEAAATGDLEEPMGQGRATPRACARGVSVMSGSGPVLTLEERELAQEIEELISTLAPQLLNQPGVP